MRSLHDQISGHYFWLKALTAWEIKKLNIAKENCLLALENWKDDYEGELGKVYNLLGIITYHLKNANFIQDSFDYFYQALSSALNHSYNIPLRVECYLNLGVLHSRIDEHQSAVYYLNKALDLNRETKIHHKVGEILMTLGISHRKMGNLDQAEHFYTKAYHLFDAYDEEKLKAGCLVNLGILYHSKKVYHKASGFLEEAIEIYKLSGDNELKFNAEWEWIDLLIDDNQLNRAEQKCKNLLNSSLKTEDKAKILFLQGKILLKDNQIEEAVKTINQTLELLKNDRSINVLHNDLSDIAHLFFEKGEYEHAAHFYHFAYKNPPSVQ